MLRSVKWSSCVLCVELEAQNCVRDRTPHDKPKAGLPCLPKQEDTCGRDARQKPWDF